MADEVKRISVELTGGTGDFQKKMEGAAKASKNLNKEVQGLDAGLKKLQKSAEDSLSGFASKLGPTGQAIAAIGPAGFAAAAGLGAMTAAAGLAAKAILDVVDKASKLTDLSTKTSLGTGFLQDLDFVASQVGVSLEDAAGAAGKLQKTLGEAKGGNEQAIKAFQAIGISIDDIRDKKFEDVFTQVFQALGNVKDESVQVALGTDLMGKSFSGTANLVRTDLVTAFEQARQSGTKLSEEQIKNADNVGDALTRLGKTTEALKLSIGSELLGSLGGGDAARGVDGITEAVKGLIAVVKDARFQQFLNVLTGGAAGGLLDALKFGVGKLAAQAPPTILSDKQIAEKTATTGPDLFTEFSGNQELTAKAKARAEEAKKAEAEAKSLAAELARLADQEQREGIEANKRWASEQAAVEKVNEAVKKRISDAQVSVFGTSKLAATEAAAQFGILQRAIEDAGGTLDSMTRDELAAYEAQLMKIEVATRADATANAEVLATLRPVQAAIDAIDNSGGFEKPKPKVEALTKATFDWSQALQDVVNTMSLLGVSADSNIGRLVGSLTSAAAAAQNLGKALKAGGGGLGGLFKSTGEGLLGKVGGFLGGLGTIGAAAGAAIGIGKAIAGLFKSDPVKKAQKEAGKALGQNISKEMAQSFLDEAKRTGKSVTQVAKEFQAAQDKAIKDEKRKNLEEGLGTAKTNVEDLLAQVKDATPALQQAAAVFANKLQSEMLKAGLGFLTTGALKDSAAFGQAQGIAGSAAGALEGFRQAGVVDQELINAAGQIAIEAQKAAFDAAKAAGLSDQEATRASFGAISGLLRAQLNSELQANGKISDTLQKQLDEAKANGIEILADPAIESLNVQKEILKTLQGQGGDRTGGAADAAREAVRRGATPAAAGFFSAKLPDMGGGLGPLIQTHPGEFAYVSPDAPIRDWEVSARADFLKGGTSGAGAGSVPANVTVNVTGAPHMSPDEFQLRVETAVGRAVQRRAPAVMTPLNKSFGRG